MAEANIEKLTIEIKYDDKGAKKKIDELTSSVANLKNTANGKALSGLTKVANSAKKSGDESKKASGSVRNFGRSAASTTAAFKRLGRAMNTTVGIAKKISSLPLKMILNPVKGVARGLQGMTKQFTGFLSGIGRIALYRAIRTGIKMVTSAVKNGVNHLYEWSTIVGNSFQKTMDTIATSTNYLTNSIGAAVSPILDTVAPVIDALVDKLVLGINAFNQFIATLTGASTWRRAEKVATSYGDAIGLTGDKAGDAKDKIKELKRTLLGFDEINKLDDNSDNGSGSGSGSGGGSDSGVSSLTFSEQPISSAVKSFADMLRDAWAKADFTEIGTIIGEKIGNALLNVPWEEKIQPTVVKLAKSFGTLLNGMFDYTGSGGKAMWDGIAYTIYNALNTAMLGYVTFFDTVNWDGIGQGVGAALKQVMENINWDWMAQALAAFPNAVIDAITGFTKQFTTQDFYNAGKNIGQTVSKALTLINWTGLFGNAVTLATGVLSAINGALENFDWTGVKDAILTGIKSIPAVQWKVLGTEVGLLAFNVIDFVANLVDTLVSTLKAGKWEQLVNGIWAGFNEGAKKYGGWGGVATSLAKWTVDNIGVLELAFAFIAGSFALKTGAALLRSKILQASMLTGGGTLGAFFKAVSVVGGIMLSIDAIKTAFTGDVSTTKTWIETSLRSGLKGALAGALIGASFGGWAGGLFGATIGAGITLSITTLKSAFEEYGFTGFMAALGGGILGAIVGGLSFGPVGAMLGFTIGTVLTLQVEKVIPDMSKVAGFGSDFSFSGANGQGSFAANASSGNASVVAEESDRVGSADTLGRDIPGSASSLQIKVVPVIDTSGAGKWFTEVQKAWESVTKNRSASRFKVAGVVNEAKEWWNQTQTFWTNGTSGRKASRFQVMGVVNTATEWWNQLQTFWTNGIKGRKASRFTVMGVVNTVSEWWNQTQNFWTNGINGRKASRFEVAGVVNTAGEWWNQTQIFWNNATSHSSLMADVKIGNTWNAFVSAFNSMQTYFNNHPLTAFVQTRTTTTTTTSSKKADGGIYKDGQWHSISQYGVGGVPSEGSLFWAREAGPELVGTIGGNTAVMNNDQIVASVSAGVAQAVASVLGGGQTNEVVVKVDSEALYRMVKKGERKANGRYSTTVAVG